MKACACEFQDVTNNDIRILIGNVAITQIPVNPNIATTGHKLQGMSKNKSMLSTAVTCYWAGHQAVHCPNCESKLPRTSFFPPPQAGPLFHFPQYIRFCSSRVLCLAVQAFKFWRANLGGQWAGRDLAETTQPGDVHKYNIIFKSALVVYCRVQSPNNNRDTNKSYGTCNMVIKDLDIEKESQFDCSLWVVSPQYTYNSYWLIVFTHK